MTGLVQAVRDDGVSSGSRDDQSAMTGLVQAVVTTSRDDGDDGVSSGSRDDQSAMTGLVQAVRDDGVSSGSRDDQSAMTGLVQAVVTTSPR